MQQRYKILLSAYACEPNKGSEPGVGWNWAIELAKSNHSVYVITRSNNKENILQYFKVNKSYTNLEFIYYDLPPLFKWLKKIGLSVNIYYLIWQFSIVPTIKQKHKEVNFDLIHHITFGVFRHPSFLYKIKVPIIFGPVGGGEYTPRSLIFSFPIKYLIIEYLRKIINCISFFNPFLLKTYNKSIIIFTKTNETRNNIPEKFLYKTKNNLEIGINNINVIEKDPHKNIFRVLYVGRLVYWKGLDIAVKSFKQLLNKNINAEFIIIGSGSYKKRIIKLAKKYDIYDYIKIIDWLPQEKLKKYYSNCDILLFPSLHDSSGNVVLESLSFGLPVICLDCGGPANVLGEKFNELIIKTKNTTLNQIINEISDVIFWLSNDNVSLENYRKLSFERAKQLYWGDIVASTYNQLSNILQKNE